MNEVNQKTPVTIRGVLTDIRSIPTQTGTAFVVCKVGEHSCKLFGDLAQVVLANQYAYDGQEMEGYGHWDVRRGSEFVIEGFDTRPAQAMAADARKLVSDTRPEKPAMKVKENYLIITIPQGVTPEQLRRITDVGNEALRGLETKIGRGVVELATVRVSESDPSEETGDIPF
jgi:hypothetical protein